MKTKPKWLARSDGLEEYDVIAADSKEDLVRQHRKMADNGWRAQGGVSVFNIPGGYAMEFFQAMVRGGK